MKKTLILLASAALLLVGCAKEQVTNGVGQKEGELQEVTFTANLESGVTTKAAVDGDGAAANVNRCIMEIYYDGERYTRQYAPVDTDKKATFTVQVPSNRTYKVAFWADKVDNTTDLATDKYYITNAEGGLQAITINGSYIGNDDARDAFFHTGTYTVAQAGSSWGDIKLYRPFAQMNVITTDWDKVKTIDALKPEKVDVTLKNALVAFNAVTGEASGSQDITYEAAVYTAPAPTSAALANEKTLSMDYLFAPKTEKAFIDIDWKALHGTDTPVAHTFAAVPYQRNYRTNIKGKLLTTTGQWTVEVNPIWETDTNGDFDYAYTSVYDIQGANDFVAKNKDKKEISVTFSTQPSDAGDPSLGTDKHPINAIVTSLLKQGATYNIDVASTTDVLYVGDYDYTTTATGTTYDYTVVLEETSGRTNAAAVNLVVTDNLYIGTLVVNSPSKSVSINGQTLESGHSYHIENLQVQEVSMNTVIIESGMVVENLEMIKGGLEIHGTVNKATVPTEHGDIAVRDCENLDETLVYNVLEPYIAEGYVGVKGRTTAGKWDIIPWVCKIDNTGYGSIADAVAEVQDGQTIYLVRDYEGDGVAVPEGKNFTLDFGGHTYTIDGTVGSQGTETSGMQLLKGSTLKFVNGNIVSTKAKLLIQNYANLTLEDMTLDLSGATQTSMNYVISNNCGNVQILGNTSLKSRANDGVAFDVYYWPDGGYPEGVNVVVNTTGTITGKIEIDHDDPVSDAAAAEKTSLKIQNGKFDAFEIAAYTGANVEISGGVFSEKPDASFIAEHFDAVANTDAATSAKYPWTVDRKHVAMIGSTKYYTLADAVADVPTNGTETTITMIADHEILGNNGVTIAKTKNVILDLAGYTIKNLVNENKGSQVIRNDGELKIIGDGLITNSAAEGTQTGEWWSTPQYNYATNVISNYGNLTIDGANLFETAISSICYAIDNNSNGVDATCTIKSGHIYTLASTAIRMFCNSTTKMNTINVEGGLIEGGYAGIWLQLPGSSPEKKKANLNISGGTLKGTYAWYDYSYGDLFDEVQVNISGGLLDGEVFSYGANIDISGGIFKSDVGIKQSKPSTVSVTGGKFSTDVCTYGENATEKFISGGLFKIIEYEYEEHIYGCSWHSEICDGKSAYYLEESHPAYAEGYRYIVE